MRDAAPVLRLSACSLIVTFEPLGACAGQVPSQRPSAVCCRAMIWDVLENAAVTVPDCKGAPQSSFTVTFNATGHPAETAKASESVVNAGWSFVGEQTGAREVP